MQSQNKMAAKISDIIIMAQKSTINNLKNLRKIWRWIKIRTIWMPLPWMMTKAILYKTNTWSKTTKRMIKIKSKKQSMDQNWIQITPWYWRSSLSRLIRMKSSMTKTHKVNSRSDKNQHCINIFNKILMKMTTNWLIKIFWFLIARLNQFHKIIIMSRKMIRTHKNRSMNRSLKIIKSNKTLIWVIWKPRNPKQSHNRLHWQRIRAH